MREISFNIDGNFSFCSWTTVINEDGTKQICSWCSNCCCLASILGLLLFLLGLAALLAYIFTHPTRTTTAPTSSWTEMKSNGASSGKQGDVNNSSPRTGSYSYVDGCNDRSDPLSQ